MRDEGYELSILDAWQVRERPGLHRGAIESDGQPPAPLRRLGGETGDRVSEVFKGLVTRLRNPSHHAAMTRLGAHRPAPDAEA